VIVYEGRAKSYRVREYARAVCTVALAALLGKKAADAIGGLSRPRRPQPRPAWEEEVPITPDTPSVIPEVPIIIQ